MVRTVRIGDWEKICLTGIARAKAGDVGWARFIADYLMGKPIQRTEVTGPDGGPQEIKHSGTVGVQVYIPDNGRDDRDPTAAGEAGEISIDDG